MNELYPSVESMSALTVFQLYEGSGEWFDLSKNRLNGLVLHLEEEKIIKNVILLRINVLGVNYVIPVVLKMYRHRKKACCDSTGTLFALWKLL